MKNIEKLIEELSNLLEDNRKLCKNCKWAKKDFFLNLMSFGFHGWKFGRCHRPSLGQDAISGKRRAKYLDIERDPSFEILGNCGSQAKYFEKKK